MASINKAQAQGARPTWIVEAVFYYGNHEVLFIDAVTLQMGILTTEPPFFGGMPEPVTREVALSAALAYLDSPDAAATEDAMTYHEDYWVGEQQYPVWVVYPVHKIDQRALGRVIVHAFTGEVLEVSSPRSGQ